MVEIFTLMSVNNVTDAGGLARKDKKHIAAPQITLVGLVQNK